MDTIVKNNENQYWQAVENRDRTFDGVFVYGVISTGIYCRPSCPARRPRRSHVIWFADGRAARSAGFRPCKRCRPDEQAFEAAVVQHACDFIDENLEEPLTLAEIAAHVYISPSHLHRLFKRSLGLTPRQYLDSRRLERFTAGLQQGETLLDAQHAAGYGSSSRVYGQRAARLGMTPAAYRRKGAGQTLTYAFADSPLGRLLVAATPRGVSFLRLGEDDEALLQALGDQYPAAELRFGGANLAELIQQVVAYLENHLPRLDLPLDLQITAFQRQVYEALSAIQRGQTRTYQQIAEQIGHPKAVRAVANACAANPTALIIPCHRVVRSDGSMGGYRWGLARKRMLLEVEASKAVDDWQI
jgi:AraC family transcriptional regulator, regulatory protein of adaptative response / methylated-DNA-[protein]-cysteine methyltransferase